MAQLPHLHAAHRKFARIAQEIRTNNLEDDLFFAEVLFRC